MVPNMVLNVFTYYGGRVETWNATYPVAVPQDMASDWYESNLQNQWGRLSTWCSSSYHKSSPAWNGMKNLKFLAYFGTFAYNLIEKIVVCFGVFCADKLGDQWHPQGL